MAFKTFAPGVLTSSDMNTFLMNQAVITCTSSTRPSSPVEGMTIYETDTDLSLQYTGTAWRRVLNITAWQSFTPTYIDFTLGNGTTNVARFFVSGRFCAVKFQVTFGSTTSVGTPSPGFTLPIPSRAGGNPQILVLFDQSTGLSYTGSFAYAGSNNVQFTRTASASGEVQPITTTAPFTWTTSDEISGVYIYETDGTS